jgi:integrase
MAGRKRTSINRRITIAAPENAATDLVTDTIIFTDAWGKAVQRFDPEQLAGLPADLRGLMVQAFREHGVGQRPATRRTTWGAILRFARYVVDDGTIKRAGDVDTAALGRYVLWLRTQAASRAPRGAHATAFDAFRPLLLWCQRNRPGALARDLEIPWNPFPGRRMHQQPRRRLPPDQIKAILSACYEEIDEVWARFQHGQDVIRRTELPPKTLRGQGLDRWIWRISRIAGGRMPDRAALEEHGIKSATLVKFWGGYRTITQYFHITTDTLVPFFLAIAIQTAANPEPLRHISRDCLVPHPLDEHRVIVDWNKAKTSARVQKAQRRSFDRRRRYAAPNLIAMMLALTEPLVADASPTQQDRLFLTRSIYTESNRRSLRSRTEVVEHSVLRRAILRFTKRANHRIDAWNAAHPDNPRSRIASFAPALFRGTVATEHYRASGGDILVAQSILNHANAATTETYLKSEETTRFQRQTIARLQDLMVAWVREFKPIVPSPGPDQLRGTVSFGHDCLAPVAADRDGAERLCPLFGGCLACPGLVIPIDTEHLARILVAIDRFEQARSRLDPRRWNLLYAPSWRILTQDILPDFPAAMHEAARALANGMPALPELE